MSFLGQILSGGTSDGTNGVVVPTNKNIVNPYSNLDQINQANQGVTNQLGNQSDVQQQLSGQNGINNQSDIYAQQQGLATQLQQESQGGGPNPAQAQLAQNTGANISSQAALMAGQRGASANPALIAREAGMQGAATQQGAVGQAATMQAQQQLAAQQQLQQQQQNLSGLATTQVGQQLSGQNNLTNQALSQQGQLLGSLGQQNANQAGITNTQQSGQNTMNAAAQQEAYKAANAIPNALGSAASLLLAKGGEVENPKLQAVSPKDRFPSHAMMAPHLKEMATLYHAHSFKNARYQPETKMASGGDVQAYSGQTNSLNVGGSLKSGGKVPGKAQVSGDSQTNDTVAAKLSPGEVVLPRSVMNSQDPVSAAAQFVKALQAKKGMSGNSQESDFKEALKRAIAGRKNK